MNKKFIIIVSIIIILIAVNVGVYFRQQSNIEKTNDVAAQLSDCLPKSDMASRDKCQQLLNGIKNFDDCVNAGFSIIKSNPAQCRTIDGKTFIQETK